MYNIKENFKDLIQIIIRSFVIVLLSPLLLILFILDLFSDQKITTSVPQIDFDVSFKNSYLPDSVTRFVRPMLPEEYKTLRSVFGLFSAKKVMSETSVEVLHMNPEFVYYLNPCGPGCCPPQLLFQIDKGDFLYVAGKEYSHGLTVFADEEENLKPIYQNLVVVRSLKSHIPLQLIGTGEPLQVKEIKISDPNEPLLFTANLKKHLCAFLRSNKLPEALQDKFTCLLESPSKLEGKECSWDKDQEMNQMVNCHNCGTELQLNNEEIKKKIYRCHVCCKQTAVQNN